MALCQPVQALLRVHSHSQCLAFVKLVLCIAEGNTVDQDGSLDAAAAVFVDDA